MSLTEATTHPVRTTDPTGQEIYALENAAGEIVQGIALIGPDEAQLAKLEDAAHASGDPGLMMLAVRQDVAAALAGTEGDYAPLAVDAVGRLHVIPSAPALTVISGTKSASGDSELIPAPGAGNRLVISAVVLQNEAATPLTMLLKDGSTTKRRYFGQNQGDGLSLVFPLGKEWRLGDNAALNLNLSDALQCGYTVDYWTEAVP